MPELPTSHEDCEIKSKKQQVPEIREFSKHYRRTRKNIFSGWAVTWFIKKSSNIKQEKKEVSEDTWNGGTYVL